MAEPKIINREQDSLVKYLRNIWENRSLIWLFAKRDIGIKYANTWLGIGWTLLQPLTGLLIFSFLFSYVLQMESASMAYPVFAFSGYISWTLFSSIFHHGAPAVYQNYVLISKVSFPKIVLNLSKVLTASLDFFLSLILLLAIMPFFNVTPGLTILLLPLVIIFNILIGLTAALFLSAAALRFRDLFHIIPYISNFGIWLTPIFYTPDLFPPQWKAIFYFNPMASAAELLRWSISGNYPLDPLLLANIPVVILLFILSLAIYNRREKTMADQI